MKLLFTGGGTAGHILPIIAVARQFRRIYEGKDLELYFMGPKDPFIDILLTQEGIKIYNTHAGKIRRYGGLRTIIENIFDLIFRTPIGLVQAFWKIFFLSPDLIFSKGGYGATPTVVAGWLLRTPIFIHESDIIPGKTNKFTTHFAKEIFVSFQETRYFPFRKMMYVGNPIRAKMLNGTKEEAKELFELVGNKPIVLVIGGSQGSQRINDMITAILPDMLRHFEVIHQTGQKNIEQVTKEAKIMLENDPNEIYYHPVSFMKETVMKHAYSAASLVVGRAGSGSIFEIAAFGKPSILIPLPESAQDHQLQNAYEYAKGGAAIVLEESNMSPHFFLERLRFLSTPEQIKKSTLAAQAFAKPNAARVISSYMLEYLGGR